jgi:hypothetical protein
VCSYTAIGDAGLTLCPIYEEGNKGGLELHFDDGEDIYLVE